MGDPNGEGRAVDGVYRAVLVIIVLGTAAWVVVAPQTPAVVDDDHLIFVNTTIAMRDGAGYYEAMVAELTRHYGGPPGSVRAFRLPTVFLMWRLFPAAWLWPLFAGFVALGSGMVAMRLSRPHAGLLVTAWLLVRGYSPSGGGWLAQWGVTEFWAVPLVLGAIWRHEEGDDIGAAALATTAALTRELVVPLLVVGGWLAWRRRRRRWPWAVSVGLVAAAYSVHAWMAARWITPPGAERALLGSAHPLSVVEMAAVNGPWVLAVAWLVAVGVLVAQRRWMFLPVIAVPLLGLVVDRDYWGVLTVPAVFVLLMGWGRSTQGPSSRRGRRQIADA